MRRQVMRCDKEISFILLSYSSVIIYLVSSQLIIFLWFLYYLLQTNNYGNARHSISTTRRRHRRTAWGAPVHRAEPVPKGEVMRERRGTRSGAVRRPRAKSRGAGVALRDGRSDRSERWTARLSLTRPSFMPWGLEEEWRQGERQRNRPWTTGERTYRILHSNSLYVPFPHHHK